MSKVKGLIFGIAVGDSLGVPVEFMSRKHLKANPVTGMRSYGTHHQPAGTWSDDTSLSFCLIEQLIEGYHIHQLSKRFCDWYQYGYWSANGEILDVGIATRNAIDRLLKGVDPRQSGECDEYSNGNGSLMRMLPLAFYLKNKDINERFALVKEISSITHAHIRSCIGCFFALEFLLLLIKNIDKFTAYHQTQETVKHYLSTQPIKASELELYSRILFEDISLLNEEEIFSSGYIVHTLEASLWAFLTTDSFQEGVLKGVNLGGDADTVGSIIGGFAGSYYGFEEIPQEWVATLARLDDIIDLNIRFGLSPNIL